MGSGRFPGKPLHLICGRPMVEHVFCRAAMFARWSGLYLATCDRQIAELGQANGWAVVMTSDRHKRALDRVTEATTTCGQEIGDEDIVVCVQGDEPMLHPDMISAVVRPMEDDPAVPCTVLGMDIVDDGQFRNPNTVKIIHDLKGDVLYTSRAPVPYCEVLTPGHGARRIYGILAFQWHFLKTFSHLPESPLERAEACDSNRILDHGFRQRVAPYPYSPSFSVDSPADTAWVEKHMMNDPLWGTY